VELEQTAAPFKIVLVEPLIPPNTGNVGRLCLATGAELHLVEPLGFSLSEKAVRRAGLDYWKHVNITMHESLAAFAASPVGQGGCWYLENFGERSIYEADFQAGDALVFGKETVGLPKEFLAELPKERILQIPMPGHPVVRSLNMAGTVHIALYEAMRKAGLF
jgi:tRNA (cytidine/uridine-2'-O-)-methyltransferase